MVRIPVTARNNVDDSRRRGFPTVSSHAHSYQRNVQQAPGQCYPGSSAADSGPENRRQEEKYVSAKLFTVLWTSFESRPSSSATCDNGESAFSSQRSFLFLHDPRENPESAIGPTLRAQYTRGGYRACDQSHEGRRYAGRTRTTAAKALQTRGAWLSDISGDRSYASCPELGECSCCKPRQRS